MWDNGYLVKLSDGSITVGPSSTMSASPPQVQGPVPAAGSHTVEVLTKLLDMSAANVAALAEAGVVGIGKESGVQPPLLSKL